MRLSIWLGAAFFGGLFLGGCGDGGGGASSCPELAGVLQGLTGSCDTPPSCVVNGDTCKASCSDGSDVQLFKSASGFTFTTADGAQCTATLDGTVVDGSCSLEGQSCEFEGSFVPQVSGSGGGTGTGGGGNSSGGNGTGGVSSEGDCEAICADLDLAGDPECVAECEVACAAPSSVCEACLCSGAGIEACADQCASSEGPDCEFICDDLGVPGDAECIDACETTCAAPPTDCDVCLCTGAGIETCSPLCIAEGE